MNDALRGTSLENNIETLEQRMQDILAMVDERIDVEAMAQIVEHLDLSDQVNKRLQNFMVMLQRSGAWHGNQLKGVQSLLRELMLDVSLVKRALIAMGQIGVAQRERIEKELILEVFPPGQVKEGSGVSVARPTGKPIVVDDCEERKPICKAACCRIFNVPLTSEEVLTGLYEWNPRAPYMLMRNGKDCVHLHTKDGLCEKYGCRPSVCSSYSCVNDKRIWLDFEGKVLNPELAAMNEGASQKQDELPERMTPPPDFSIIRDMIPPEPKHKFVPPAEATKSAPNSNIEVSPSVEAGGIKAP